ncbi:MAG: hypothetical protein ACKVOO_06105 [Burkholderiaceae bacterium]
MSAPQSTHSNRLALSRERLRVALHEETRAHSQQGASRSSDDQGGPSMMTTLVASASAVPAVAVVIEALGSWWAQHPLRSVGGVAADAAKAMVLPVAQRHPAALVAGAFVFGGLLMWSRPWRWLLKPALFSGLLPQLVSKTLSHLPIHTWAALLGNVLSKQEAPVTRAEAKRHPSDQKTHGPTDDAWRGASPPGHF